MGTEHISVSIHRLAPWAYATSLCHRGPASPQDEKPDVLVLQVMEVLYSVSYSSSERNLESCSVGLAVLNEYSHGSPWPL